MSGREVQVLGPVGFLPNQSCRLDGAPVPLVDGGDTNDAAALGAADVFIAMATVTDIAMSSAPLTLIKGDTRGVWRVRVVSINRTEHAAESCFRVCLQRGQCADCRRRAVPGVRLGAQPDDCRTGHEPVFGVGGGECAATTICAFTCRG